MKDYLKDLLRDKGDIASMISQIQDEYKNSNISKDSYNELKNKFTTDLDLLNEKIKDIENPSVKNLMEKLFKHEQREIPDKAEKIDIDREPEKMKQEISKEEKPAEEKKEEPKKEEKEKDLEPGEMEEVTPEIATKLAEQMATDAGVTGSSNEKTQDEEETEEEEGTGDITDSKLGIELEKLKVKMDTMRETKQAADETVRNMSENIGEIRSMVQQADVSIREVEAKLEKTSDEISEVKPVEISKKFKEIDSNVQGINLTLEKLTLKGEDVADKINSTYNLMKKIGGIENLIELNKHMQKKVDDVNEVMKYIQRLSVKIEKMFIDMNKNMEDFVGYKIRQDGTMESVGDLIKGMDDMNTKLESYMTKKDYKNVDNELILIKQQIEEINKMLPMTEIKIPETILDIRKERDDIVIFIDTLEDQLKKSKISLGDYEVIKKENKRKISELEDKIKNEWKNVLPILKNLKEKSESTLEIPEKTTIEENDEKGSTDPKKITEEKKEEITEKPKENVNISKEETHVKIQKQEEVPQEQVDEINKNLTETPKENTSTGDVRIEENKIELEKKLEEQIIRLENQIENTESIQIGQKQEEISQVPISELPKEKKPTEETKEESKKEEKSVEEKKEEFPKEENPRTTKEMKEIREDLQNLMKHLEDEYRSSNISEKSYHELKEKYTKQLEEIEKNTKHDDLIHKEGKESAVAGLMSSFLRKIKPELTEKNGKKKDKGKKGIFNTINSIKGDI